MSALDPPAAADGLAWIEIALIIFFVVFVVIVLGVLLAKRGRYDAAAQIPLDDDRIMTPRGAIPRQDTDRSEAIDV